MLNESLWGLKEEARVARDHLTVLLKELSYNMMMGVVHENITCGVCQTSCSVDIKEFVRVQKMNK
jgi:hypothetical protein